MLNLHYDYNAAAGQMGVGTTAGNAGQLRAINSNSTINGAAESAAYTYDNLGRLVTSSQTSNGSSAQRRFAYDRFGNRTAVWDATSGGNQIQSVALEQSGSTPTNRISAVNGTSYLYDAAGNVTSDGAHSYSYDAENRLVSVDNGTTASYVYDQQNRRLKKTTGGSLSHYVWQGGHVLAEYNGGTGALQTEFIYAGSRRLAKIEGGATNYFLSDRLSVRLLLDASGNVVGRQAHLPFGEDFSESGAPQKQHFTSYERDAESGIDYAVNRYYGPTTGRFTTVDPSGGSSDISNPQSLNRYAYSGNEPINRTDPLGLDPWSIIDLGNGEIAYRNCFGLGENRVCEWRIYSEYEPKGKEPKPCTGHTKAPLKGKRLDKYTSQRDILLDKLQHSDRCRSYLNSLGINLDDAISAVNLQRAYEGDKSDISNLEAGLVSPDTQLDLPQIARYANGCVSTRFKVMRGKLGAATALWPGGELGATVQDRSDVYYGQDISASNILHEALHSLLAENDDQLANRLDVKITPQNTQPISDALHDHGCGGD